MARMEKNWNLQKFANNRVQYMKVENALSQWKLRMFFFTRRTVSSYDQYGGMKSHQISY